MVSFSAIMAGLGTAASLAGNMVSGIMSTRNNKRMQRESDAYYDSARGKTEGMYNSQIYQDPMRRAENVSVISTADRRMKRADDVAAGRQRVVGGTNEARLAQRGRLADSYAQLLSNIAGNASKRVDALVQGRNKQLMGLDASQQQTNMGLLQSRNKTYENLAANATTLAGNSLYALGGASKTKNNGTAQGTQVINDGTIVEDIDDIHRV